MVNDIGILTKAKIFKDYFGKMLDVETAWLQWIL